MKNNTWNFSLWRSEPEAKVINPPMACDTCPDSTRIIHINSDYKKQCDKCHNNK